MWVNCFRGPVSLLHIGTIGKCTNELLYAPMYVICITYLCTEGLKVDFLYSVDILFDVKETIFIMIWSLFSLSLTGQTKEQSQLIQRGFLGLTWKDAAIAILLITIIISCSTMALWAIKGRKRSSTEKLILIRVSFRSGGTFYLHANFWFEKSRSVGNFRKISGSGNPDFLSGSPPWKKLGLY